MVIEDGIKHIRMGWDKNFIKAVILSDDTVIQNMQCDLDAKIPTDIELKEIDRRNTVNKEEKLCQR